MRYHLLINKIIIKFTKNINFSSDVYFLLLSAITQLIILDFKDTRKFLSSTIRAGVFFSKPLILHDSKGLSLITVSELVIMQSC